MHLRRCSPLRVRESVVRRAAQRTPRSYQVRLRTWLLRIIMIVLCSIIFFETRNMFISRCNMFIVYVIRVIICDTFVVYCNRGHLYIADS